MKAQLTRQNKKSTAIREEKETLQILRSLVPQRQ